MMITFLIFSSLSASSQVPSLMNLASDPSFENIEQKNSGWYPVGIVVEGKEPLAIVDDVSRTGARSMKVEVGPSGPTDGTVHYSSFNAGEGTRKMSGHSGVRGARTIAYRLDRDVGSIKSLRLGEKRGGVGY